MKLWSSFNPVYIETFLHDLRDDVQEINLWQNVDDLRERYTGAFTNISHDSCSIKLDEKYSAAYGRINVQLPLYIHSTKQDMLFRRDVFRLENGVISFKTPYEVKFRDKRVSERFCYKYQDFKNISYTIGSDPQVHSFILTDISTAGASFVIPQSERETLSVGDEISIRALSDQKLPEGCKSVVIYAKHFALSRESDSKLLQIGICFSQTLDSISYKSISNFVQKKQKKVRGLDTDKFNGLNPDQYKKTMNTIKSQNPQLAANIADKVENLDRLRYLTLEMKRQFLLEINHDLLAASLRMSSKELIFDLLSEVTDSIRDEFLYKLDVAKPASAVNKAQDQICKFIADKEKSGELVLDPKSFIQFV